MNSGNIPGSFGELLSSIVKALVKIWPESQGYAHGWSNNPIGLARRLTKALGSGISYLIATFLESVNYDLSVEHLVSMGRYDGATDSRLSSAQCPSNESTGRQVWFGLFHFYCEDTPSHKWKELMAKEGYRLATIKETLTFALSHPWAHRRFSVVSPGAVIDGGKILWLHSKDDEHYLHLVNLVDVKCSDRVLGVRIE